MIKPVHECASCHTRGVHGIIKFRIHATCWLQKKIEYLYLDRKSGLPSHQLLLEWTSNESTFLQYIRAIYENFEATILEI